MEYVSVPGLGVELDGAVLRLTIDRPTKRNALDDVSMAGMLDALERARTDDQVRVVVLVGAGADFCSGFDIVGRNAAGDERPRVGSIQRRLPTQANRLVPMLLEIQLPVVAVVRGWAAGLGFQLALASDFTVAADDARFWQPYTSRGFTADAGATWLLPRLVGPARAKDLLVLGRELTGREAADWGLVHSAVSPDVLDAEAARLVDRLASAATVAVGLTKWLVNQAPSTDLHQQLANEAFAMELSSRSGDFREGLAAFREKRDPRFDGR